MLALAILVVGAGASFFCYTRLSAILPMSQPNSVTHATATIETVQTPMIKKGQSGSDVVNDVRYSFSVNEQKIEGAYTLKDRSKAPAIGDKEPIVYLSANPRVFLREEEYRDLPRQITALRVMMVAFALTALVLPFAVMKHGT